jgi:hypothetical protein
MKPAARVRRLMKTKRPIDGLDPVRKLMQEWKVTASLPPRFNEGVWRRIQRADSGAEVSLWSRVTDWLAEVLPRPAVAVSYVTVLLALGIASGYWQARKHAAQLDHELGARYVQSVDPYQKPHS